MSRKAKPLRAACRLAFGKPGRAEVQTIIDEYIFATGCKIQSPNVQKMVRIVPVIGGPPSSHFATGCKRSSGSAKHIFRLKLGDSLALSVCISANPISSWFSDSPAREREKAEVYEWGSQDNDTLSTRKRSCSTWPELPHRWRASAGPRKSLPTRLVSPNRPSSEWNKMTASLSHGVRTSTPCTRRCYRPASGSSPRTGVAQG